MPFGSFEVKVKFKKPAAVKPPQEEKKVPVAPPMPKKEEPPVVTPMKEPVKPRMEPRTVIDSVTLHIALYGRNLMLIQEYLCAMNQNMGEALHREGMTFYTREMDTISDVTRVKKKLEQYFWQVSDQPWKYSADEAGNKEYVFSVSPSGDQKKSLDLIIHCVTPKADSMPPIENMDAVWVLTDGLMLDEHMEADSYTVFVREQLKHVKGRTDEIKQPVCLIMGQIEKMGHFDTVDGQTKLPAKAQKSLIDICKKRFEDLAGAGTEMAVIPVQIYGGLECVDKDEKGNPVQKLGESGFYQSLIQENCQMPVLYTILKICENRAVNYFDDMVEQGMKYVIQQHFSKKTGNAGWRPETLGGKKVE